MSTTDPIADMLTRIRNASAARHDYCLVPASNMKIAIAKLLKERNYVRDFDVLRDCPQRTLRVWLGYTTEREPAVTVLRRISKPGLRVYVKSKEIPRVRGGMGTAIVSTPKGMMTGDQARRLKLGGEVVCLVW